MTNIKDVFLVTVSTVTPGWKLRWNNLIYPAAKGVPLTDGEIALVKGIFGKQIKTDRIKKYFSPNTDGSTAAQNFGRKGVKFFGDQYYSLDYSKADIRNFGIFMHEMTHSFQHKKILRHYFNSLFGSVDYDYELSPTSRFRKFGVEQQASIIEDYAREFLYTGDRERSWPGKYNCVNNRRSWQELTLLQKGVEDRFPEARKTRLVLEARGKAAAAAHSA